MRSRTKSELSEDTIRRLFACAGIEGVTDIAPLGAGEFNAVYAVKAGGKDYALKVAPPPEIEVLPYERGMMASEIYWYKRMREDTIIKVPEVYYYDDSGKIIPSAYFIMDKIDGVQPEKLKLSKEEKAGLNRKMCELAASMHRVRNDKFGYIQQKLYDDWYQAIRSMTVSLIEGCEAKGRKTKHGEKLLGFIDKYKDILEKVECRMVNYDIWSPNMVAKRCGNEIRYWWIDPERSFWGDRMADFVCLQMTTTKLADKKEAVSAYNSYAEEPVEINRQTEIRYGIMLAFMGLIMETEKYYRYSPAHFGWWRNLVASNFVFFKAGFAALK